VSWIRGRGGVGDAGSEGADVDVPGVDPDGRRILGGPTGEGWETAVQARRIDAALLRHTRLRRIAEVEATLPA
jgi:hypothetical protein